MDVKPCLVAFVDLLGFSARVRALETPEELQKLARDVQKVQKFFGHQPSDPAEKEYQGVVDKTVLAFSDCVVVSVSYQSDAVSSGGTFDIPMSELHSLALAQGECVMQGIFLRGGCSFGFWAHDENLVVSDAMVEAYELEKRACAPVIAIDEDYYARICAENDRQYYSEDFDPVPKLFRRSKVGPNDAEIWFLNYLWVLLDALDPQLTQHEKAEYVGASAERRHELHSIGYIRAARTCCIEHANLIRAEHSKTDNAGVRYKYEWLASYHDETVRAFYKEPESELLIGSLAA